MSRRRLVAPFLRQLAGDPLGLGRSAQSARSERLQPRTKTADRVVQSICPYCAVGCAQKVYVKDEKVIQIEGDPDSPISRGRLCPKGSASEGLVNSPMREHKVKYRRPGATDWEELSLEQATDMIAERMISVREQTWEAETDDGEPLHRTLGMHFLGGATLDSEENYLIKKFFTAARGAVDREPGPHMTQLNGPRSGDLVRARRRHHVPAGPAELRLHPDHGLQHGRAAPGRLPVGG